MDEFLYVTILLELFRMFFVQVPGFVNEQLSKVLLRLECDLQYADEYVGLLLEGLPLVIEEQFGVHFQARHVASCVHIEFDALECVAYLEFIGHGLVTQCFSLVLHPQLELLFIFQDPVLLLDLLSL